MKKSGFKKLVVLCMVMVMICSSLSVSAAATYKSGGKTRVYTGAAYKMYYNSKLVTKSSRYGVMINDNVMIPYKYTLVKNGPKAIGSYNKYTNKLTLKYGRVTAILTPNSNYMYVNGVKTKLNTAPLFINYNGTNCLVVPAKAICAALNLEYIYNRSTKSVYITKPSQVTNSSTSASTVTTKAFNGMTTAQFIRAIGTIAQKDYQRTGVLASVTIAQAINESGWGKSGLAQKSNNMFGMKISLSGNNWSGSTWDGKSYVSVTTTEESAGKKYSIIAKFRKYPCVNNSIYDHSAYLSNAKNGFAKRYAGLTNTSSYSKQLSILQKGGYCTWSGYVRELSSIISRYNLTQYDVK